MEKIELSGKTFGVEKLTATQAFKLQLRVIKILGSGILDGLQGVDIKNIKGQDSQKIFDAIGKFIAKTDDEDVFNFVMDLLSKNVYLIGSAEGEEVKIKLNIDAHLKDDIFDIYKLAMFVLKVNLGKSLDSIKSSLSLQ